MDRDLVSQSTTIVERKDVEDVPIGVGFFLLSASFQVCLALRRRATPVEPAIHRSGTTLKQNDIYFCFYYYTITKTCLILFITLRVMSPLGHRLLSLS